MNNSKVSSPSITVCITSYNQRQYIIEAIESVLNQSLIPFEIIVVDDCSTDGSKQIIQNYAKKYPKLIKPFFNKENLGIPKTKNFCFEEATGDLVTLLDGDDRFLPNKLEKELEIFSNNKGTKIVISNHFFIDEHGKQTGVWCRDNNISLDNLFREVFSLNSPLWSYRNELIDYTSLKKIGFYDNDLTIYEDWDLRVRQSKFLKATYCPELLSEYRLHKGGIHRTQPSLHYSCMKKVYEKNKALFYDLPQLERNLLEKSMNNNLASFANKTAREELERGNKMGSFKYWLESLQYDFRYFDPKLVIQLFLPQRMSKHLKKYLIARG